jgi:hypothetical protein
VCVFVIIIIIITLAYFILFYSLEKLLTTASSIYIKSVGHNLEVSQLCHLLLLIYNHYLTHLV